LDSPTLDLTKLGRRIRFLRQGKTWSLSDLAERSGVSKAYISDVENGSAGKPNIQYVYDIARALGVTLDELLEGAAPEAGARSRGEKQQDLPPGLAQLQRELALSDEDAQMLAHVNFRGNRPRTKEEWRYLWDTIRMLTHRPLQK
jgi:transcriptional regulator with XRE-family HTH domain